MYVVILGIMTAYERIRYKLWPVGKRIRSTKKKHSMVVLGIFVCKILFSVCISESKDSRKFVKLLTVSSHKLILHCCLHTYAV